MLLWATVATSLSQAMTRSYRGEKKIVTSFHRSLLFFWHHSENWVFLKTVSFHFQSITVWRTQPGPPDVFLSITRRVQNKRTRVRSFRTNRKWGTCGEKFVSINKKATKYLLKGATKNVGWPRLSSLHCKWVLRCKTLAWKISHTCGLGAIF